MDSLKNKLFPGDGCTEDKNSKSSKPTCPANGEPRESAEDEAPKPPEDSSSAKSNVYDLESPRLTEPGNSSQGLDLESSETEDGNSLMIGKSLLAPLGHLPKIEDGYGCSDPTPVDYTSCSFGFSSEDHPFWNWTY